ncbi:unnamed protein product [Cuscuta campestris]|uniref:Uncharacterized protein n=1 Tax=Cuscuta campestris TaxID=132261 RepID=A0A484NHX4_9ASTE|nr:unnamed protein product [Cuscuta campestris]
MESDYFLYDSIIPETEFKDIGVEDEVIHLSSTSDAKKEDEVIVILSDDDDADVAPVRDMNAVIVLDSDEDSLFGSEEDGSFEDVEGFHASSYHFYGQTWKPFLKIEIVRLLRFSRLTSSSRKILHQKIS